MTLNLWCLAKVLFIYSGSYVRQFSKPPSKVSILLTGRGVRPKRVCYYGTLFSFFWLTFSGGLELKTKFMNFMLNEQKGIVKRISHHFTANRMMYSYKNNFYRYQLFLVSYWQKEFDMRGIVSKQRISPRKIGWKQKWTCPKDFILLTDALLSGNSRPQTPCDFSFYIMKTDSCQVRVI